MEITRAIAEKVRDIVDAGLVTGVGVQTPGKMCVRKHKPYEQLGHVVGRRRSPTHGTWTNMVARCTNPKRPDYRYYGARGVTVCDRWRNSVADFIEDMGLKPDGMSLDRIDNARGYEPGNCRWATKRQQMQNTRTNRLITFAGQTKCLNEWARDIGINHESLRTRFERGWSIEKALTTGATR